MEVHFLYFLTQTGNSQQAIWQNGIVNKQNESGCRLDLQLKHAQCSPICNETKNQPYSSFFFFWKNPFFIFNRLVGTGLG